MSQFNFDAGPVQASILRVSNINLNTYNFWCLFVCPSVTVVSDRD